MNMMMVAKMAVQPSMAINRQRHPTSQPIMVHCRSMPHAPQPISEAADLSLSNEFCAVINELIDVMHS